MKLSEEAKELYFYTKGTKETAEKLEKISPSCVAPLIATRKVVKTAMQNYIREYCTYNTKIEDIFSEKDFQEVSKKIHSEIMAGEL